ncbi:MAG: glycerol-3-phosphate acyltransferase PlsY [Lentimonas sp.]|jgi:glycerol-3-phosphate acyltransferase PlsY
MTFYYLLFLTLTYLISAVPFGLVIAKFFAQKDITKLGSGNIGATNVARTCGKTLGIVTLILDGLKGAIMVLIARTIFSDAANLEIFLSLVGAVAVIGHIFPVYLKFKGGKGVATGIAVLVAIDPIIGLFTCLAWAAIFIFTRIVSIASLLSIISTLGFTFYIGSTQQNILLVSFVAFLIIVRHSANIKRILNNEEAKL